MAALGLLYAEGVGVPHDEQKARELIQKTAKKDAPRLCKRFGKATNRPDSTR
jgi:TPR repeat protein